MKKEVEIITYDCGLLHEVPDKVDIDLSHWRVGISKKDIDILNWYFCGPEIMDMRHIVCSLI